jgi:hypothetical protein
MSLSLAQLDESIRNLDPDDPEINVAFVRLVSEYAHERAAREACEALGKPGDALQCAQIRGMSGSGYAYIAVVVPVEGDDQPSAYGVTPTAAYLALLEKLAIR